MEERVVRTTVNADGRGIVASSFSYWSHPSSDTIRHVSMSARAVVSRRPGIESQSIDLGAIVVDLKSGAAFELNRIGAEIWELMASPVPVHAICDVLATRYSVERQALDADVLMLIDALLRAGLADASPVQPGGDELR